MGRKIESSGVSVTLSCGHKCAICANKRRRQEARAAGLPAWKAFGYAPEGWIKQLTRTNEFRRNHLRRYARYKAGDRQRQKEQYGGDPSIQWQARVKWIEEKMLKRRKATKRKGGSTTCRKKAKHHRYQYIPGKGDKPRKS